MARGEVKTPEQVAKEYNKGPKKKKPKTAGHADPRLLGHVALVGAQAMCAVAYDDCLDSAAATLDSDLDTAQRLKSGCGGVDVDEYIANALRIHNLSAAECATKYAICGLAALLPF